MFELLFEPMSIKLTRRASVFRIPRSQFWFAAYRDAKGRRVQRTTKCVDEGEAMRKALKWAEAAESGRSGLLTEAACRKVLSELHEQANGSQISFYTIQGWFDEWLKNREGTAQDRTLERYTGTSNDFLKYLGERAKLPLVALTAADVRGFRDDMKTTGHSPATCNQVMKILSAPLEQGRKLGVIPVNPAHGVTPLKDERIAKRDAFTIDQIQALLNTAKGTDWEGCILLGAFAGLRLKDAANITWGAVNLESGMIVMETAKRGVGVNIPVHPALMQWLKGREQGIGRAPLLPALAGKSGSGKSGLSMSFKRVMVRAGVIGEISRTGKGAGRTTSTLSFHSTRHFFVSALSSAGVPADVRQRLAGHTDARTHAVYAAHELESVRDAIQKMPMISSHT